MAAAQMAAEVPSDVSRAHAQAETLAMVSHELAGRLMTVVGFSGRLVRSVEQGRSEIDDEMRESIEMLYREAIRMQSITSLFLDQARLDAGALEVETAPVEVMAVVEQELNTLRREQPEVNAWLDAGTTRGATIVESDERCIRRVVANLLDNATKYGGVAPEVAVTVEREARGVLVCVRDNGLGVPEGEEARIFERFYRAPATARRSRGLGLGLYISRRLSEQIGASLTVANSPFGGAEFRLWLPAGRREPW